MKVLVATDHSPSAEAAIDLLTESPLSHQFDVELMSVMPLAYEYASIGTEAAFPMTLFSPEQIAEAESRLQHRCDQVAGHFHSVRAKVVAGNPGFDIVSRSEAGNFDLVVIGALGHTALQRIALGSVSDYVATHGTKSTLVFRHQTDKPTSEHRTAVVAVSDSINDGNLIRWIDRLSLPTDWVAHIIQLVPVPALFGVKITAGHRELFDAVKSRASANCMKFATELRHRGHQVHDCIMETEHIGESIVQKVIDHAADLVIVGDSRRNVLKRFILGSTSRYVLRHSPSSVLIDRVAVKDSETETASAETIATA